LFHLAADRWPGAVDVAAVGRFAEAATTIVMKLASAG
jgi:hypothetical protein